MNSSSLVEQLPLAFDPKIYRDLNPDLARMTDQEQRRHYDRYGLDEGRRCHALVDRFAFASLARNRDSLEIGPFNTPLLRGPRIRYFDVLDSSGLRQRAKRLGRPVEGVPEHVHFVSPTGNLSVVEGTFEAVLSSHVIEHQPDLIRHLQAITRLLRPGGAYLLLVPDKRYCFDHPHAPSTIADVLEAHYSKRLIHTLQSQLEHEALTTHNNGPAYWAGERAQPPDVVKRAREVLSRYRAAPNDYVDVHAWYFTPATFAEIIRLLQELGHISLRVARMYPSLLNNNEFWVALEPVQR
jgi:SAM-dependent methyltransferase